VDFSVVICCDGYTSSFYEKNSSAKKKLDERMSSLQAYCLFLLYQLKDRFHVCGVDILYISSHFFREEKTGRIQFLCHEDARKEEGSTLFIYFLERTKEEIGTRQN
jgi:hypothetical protein